MFVSNINSIPEKLNIQGKDLSSQEVMNKLNKEKNYIFTISKIKKINNWTKEEDNKLLNIIQSLKTKNWRFVSNFFDQKTPVQCSSRYRRIQPGIQKGYWTKDEDLKLISLFDIHGKNWKNISKEMINRSGKQIRDRFLNSLNPEFNKKEDNHLIFLYKKYGPSWSKISNHFRGRSGDMIKNRFYSFIRMKKYDFSKTIKLKKRVLLNKNIPEENKIKKNVKINIPEISNNIYKNNTNKIINHFEKININLNLNINIQEENISDNINQNPYDIQKKCLKEKNSINYPGDYFSLDSLNSKNYNHEFNNSILINNNSYLESAVFNFKNISHFQKFQLTKKLCFLNKNLVNKNSVNDEKNRLGGIIFNSFINDIVNNVNEQTISNFKVSKEMINIKNENNKIINLYVNEIQKVFYSMYNTDFQ